MRGGGFVCTWKRPLLCLRCIKDCFVFWKEVLNCGFNSDACLRTQRSLTLFFSLSPFYFLFLCRLIDMLLPLLTSHKGDIWERKKKWSKQTKTSFLLWPEQFVTGCTDCIFFRSRALVQIIPLNDIPSVKHASSFAATRSWMPEVYRWV